jgi:epoxyqueuosine reductase
VCPFNQSNKALPSAPELQPKAVWQTKQLVDLLFLGSAQYRALIRGTALRRTFRVQLSRNAAVALGNTGEPAAVEPLFRAAESHTFDIVKEHATWALGELAIHHKIPAAAARLRELITSPVPEVRVEVEAWLEKEAGTPGKLSAG